MLIDGRPISELKILAAANRLSQKELAILRADRRKGMASVIRSAEKARKENQRLQDMLSFDLLRGKSVIGIDEAGRGPLAGPVVAAAVVSGSKLLIPGSNDSKKIPEKRRRELCQLIMESGQRYAIGLASVEEIDTLNILEATRLAMFRALEGLRAPDAFVITDALWLPGIKEQYNPVKGDQLSLAVAAASILAKVYRDNLMTAADVRWPEYGFAVHKGYGTASHIGAIRRFGPCPLHRLSFEPLKSEFASQDRNDED